MILFQPWRELDKYNELSNIKQIWLHSALWYAVSLS
jgi:hypothetical protein